MFHRFVKTSAAKKNPNKRHTDEKNGREFIGIVFVPLPRVVVFSLRAVIVD